MSKCAKGHFIPDKALTCPDCATERAKPGMQAFQAAFLRKAADGVPNYTLRVARGSERHVLMYMSYTQTFCGRELKSKPQIAYEPLDADVLSRVCAGCRIEIKRALQEAE